LTTTEADTQSGNPKEERGYYGSKYDEFLIVFDEVTHFLFSKADSCESESDAKL